jgi:hypothetical protein
VRYVLLPFINMPRLYHMTFPWLVVFRAGSKTELWERFLEL